MIMSNININSNIYIRRNNDVTKDLEYIKRITGKRLLEQAKNNLRLTPVQKKILNESKPCIFAKNGEQTHGVVKAGGELVWSCRCEQKQCKYYQDCMQHRFAKKIERSQEVCGDDSELDSLKKFIKELGITIEDDEVFFEHDKNPITEEEESEIFIKLQGQTAKEKQLTEYRYLEITEPSRIIEAPLETHIILNSGPGTGKTYTIIQRLIYILKNRLCDAEEIYILCYTRSAEKVIEDQIKAAVVNGELEPSAVNICILTFDSYAGYFLLEMKEQGVITEDFSGFDYNQRIALFNKHITAEDLEDIKYFIVDEIQDLVNERAKMVLKLLKLLDCGYLLAGDRCQSIYDYSAESDLGSNGNAEIDSVRFYQMAEELFPADMQRYEITVNRRQCKELARESEKMRRVLLNEEIYEQNRYANEAVKQYIQNIGIKKYICENLSEMSESTAILCRSNIQAEYVSSLLCKKKINHMLNRGVNFVQPLPRWIADVFWDECRDVFGRNDFLDRFNFRCTGEQNPERLWKLLCEFTGNYEQNPQELNLSVLAKQLTVSSEIPDEFYEDKPSLTVSTIHKAKGSEFENVILLASRKLKYSHDSAEEARVRYVALTRPKKKLAAVKGETKYSHRLPSGRVIEKAYHNLYGTNTFCKSIAIGLNGDIDCCTFVSGDFENAVDLQEYISSQIKLYDKLTAKYSDKTERFEIFHNGKCISAFSAQLENALLDGINATDYNYKLPSSLENLYVSGITTEILKKLNGDIPVEYQKSRMCYGVQITGLARLVFEKRR